MCRITNNLFYTSPGKEAITISLKAAQVVPPHHKDRISAVNGLGHHWILLGFLKHLNLQIGWKVGGEVGWKELRKKTRMGIYSLYCLEKGKTVFSLDKDGHTRLVNLLLATGYSAS